MSAWSGLLLAVPAAAMVAWAVRRRTREHVAELADAAPVVRRVHDVVRGARITDPPMRRLPLARTATKADIGKAEAALGYPLPPVLGAIYRLVANGGFGPGYGVMGIGPGFPDDQGHTAESLSLLFRESDPAMPEWEWQPRWLPICHWGCAMYSVVDCVAPYPVLFYDPSLIGDGSPMSAGVVVHKASLDEWLDDWMAGRDLCAEGCALLRIDAGAGTPPVD